MIWYSLVRQASAENRNCLYRQWIDLWPCMFGCVALGSSVCGGNWSPRYFWSGSDSCWVSNILTCNLRFEWRSLWGVLVPKYSDSQQIITHHRCSLYSEYFMLSAFCRHDIWRFYAEVMDSEHTVNQKNQDTRLLSVTLPNANRFSKFWHW